MIETVFAVLIITSLFFLLFGLSQKLTGKIAVEHAAMRVARARAVGMNRYICLKTARLAAVPAAGKRLWPEDEHLDVWQERGRFDNYLLAVDEHVARGILDYEGWADLAVEPGDGTDARVRMSGAFFDLTGRAGVERHADFYLQDNGL